MQSLSSGGDDSVGLGGVKVLEICLKNSLGLLTLRASRLETVFAIWVRRRRRMVRSIRLVACEYSREFGAKEALRDMRVLIPGGSAQRVMEEDFTLWAGVLVGGGARRGRLVQRSIERINKRSIPCLSTSLGRWTS